MTPEEATENHRRVNAALVKAALEGVEALDERELMIWQWIQNGGGCASCGAR